MSRTPFSGIWAPAAGEPFAIAGGHLYAASVGDIVRAPGSRPCAYSASVFLSLNGPSGRSETVHLRTSGNDVMSLTNSADQTYEFIRVPDTDPFYTPVAQNLVVLGAFASVQLALAALSNAQPWAVAWPPCNPCPCLDQGCPVPLRKAQLPGAQGSSVARMSADAVQMALAGTCGPSPDCPCYSKCPTSYPTASCDPVRDARAGVAYALANDRRHL